MNILENIMELIRVRQHPDEFFERMLRALSQKRSVQQIIEIACEYLGNPLVVVNSCFNLVAHVGMDGVEDPNWLQLKKDGYPSYELVSSYSADHTLERLANATEPILAQGTLFQHAQLASNIFVGGRIAAMLLCPCLNRPFCNMDHKILSLLSNGLSMVDKRHSFIEYAKGMSYEYLMVDILDGKIDADTLQEKGKYIKLPQEGNFFAVAIDVSAMDQPRMMLDYMRESLERLLPGSRTVVYYDHIAVCISCRTEEHFPEEYRKRLSGFLAEYNLFGAVSRCFHRIRDMRTYYEQSLQTLRLACEMKRRETLSFYEEYVPYRMFDAAKSRIDLLELCDASLLRLREYDLKYATANCATLRTFLRHERSITGTAAELGLHQNSLRYRIKRIQEIMGNDLEDSYYRFRLNLSFEILEYLGTNDPGEVAAAGDLPERE